MARVRTGVKATHTAKEVSDENAVNRVVMLSSSAFLAGNETRILITAVY